MGIFGGRRQRGKTPAEEAARRRGSHIPEARDLPDRAPTAAAPASGSPSYETKAIKLAQIGMNGRTNVEARLAPLLAEGWEVVAEDRKRYGVGGKPSILLRRRLG